MVDSITFHFIAHSSISQRGWEFCLPLQKLIYSSHLPPAPPPYRFPFDEPSFLVYGRWCFIFSKFLSCQKRCNLATYCHKAQKQYICTVFNAVYSCHSLVNEGIKRVQGLSNILYSGIFWCSGENQPRSFGSQYNLPISRF